jgi:hypothetical protein
VPRHERRQEQRRDETKNLHGQDETHVGARPIATAATTVSRRDSSPGNHAGLFPAARHALSASSLMRPRGETWRARRQAASAYLLTARSERRPIGSTSSQPMARPLPGHNVRRTEICAEVNLWETSGYGGHSYPGPFLRAHRPEPQILLGSSRLKHFLSPATSARAPNAQSETRRVPRTS